MDEFDCRADHLDFDDSYPDEREPDSNQRPSGGHTHRLIVEFTDSRLMAELFATSVAQLSGRLLSADVVLECPPPGSEALVPRLTHPSHAGLVVMP